MFCLDVSVTLSGMLHRKVALIVVEVVRLVGSIASLRPHIGLVFSHLLSATACSKHGIPFNILNKVDRCSFRHGCVYLDEYSDQNLTSNATMIKQILTPSWPIQR